MLQNVNSWEKALAQLPDANLAVISVPGAYAALEADRALDEGMHVFMFSDNVSPEEELRLKQKAHAKGLLVMGPDCGPVSFRAYRSPLRIMWKRVKLQLSAHPEPEFRN